MAAPPVMDIPGVLECRIKQRFRALPAYAASCPEHCGCARRCSDESWSSAPRVSGGRCAEGEVAQRLEWASIGSSSCLGGHVGQLDVASAHTPTRSSFFVERWGLKLSITMAVRVFGG